MERNDKVRVLEEGGIGDDFGILYDADAIEDLSPAAAWRLAELHNADPSLQWEGDRTSGRLGAQDILRAVDIAKRLKEEGAIILEGGDGDMDLS